MAFDLARWQQELRGRLGNVRAGIIQVGANSAYGYVALAALLPVLQATASGEGTVVGLLGLAGSVGSNLVAEHLQRWQDRAETSAEQQTLAAEIVQRAATDNVFRAALDVLLVELAWQTQAKEALTAETHEWLLAAWQTEYRQLGQGNMQVVLGGVNFEGTGPVSIQGHVAGGDIYITEQGPDPTEAAVARARVRYLTRLYQRCNLLPLVELGGQQTAEEELTLRDVYVVPATSSYMALNLEEHTRQSGPLRARVMNAVEVATERRRLVLLGDPGSGKSSVVRQLVAELAQAYPSGQAWADGWEPGLLPVLIVLRELAPRLATLALEGGHEAQRRVLVGAVWEQWRTELAHLDAPEFVPGLQDALVAGTVLLVFDGLDEVAEAWRGRVQAAVRAVIEAYPALRRLIVTCRTRSYTGEAVLPTFYTETLVPFDKEKIRGFIGAWYGTLARRGVVTAAHAVARARDLTEAAQGADLLPLAKNPMLLTAMTLLHQQNVGLPRERVRLYAQTVRLLLERWQRQRGIPVSQALERLLHNERQLRQIMERLGYEAHRVQATQGGEGDLTRGALLELLDDPELLGASELRARDFLDYVDQRAGLLVGQGGEAGRPAVYRFPHRTFQEYLAGCQMVRGGHWERPDEFWARAAEGDFWRVAAQLGTEELYYGPAGEKDVLALAYALNPVVGPVDEQGWRAVLWSGQMAVLVGVEAVQRVGAARYGDAAYLGRLLGRLMQLLEGEGLPVVERAEAGRVLGALGDPRPGVGLRADGVPDIQWVELPGGTFRLGGDDDACNSLPKQEVMLEPFWLAKYPVTNTQWDAFLKARDGYAEAQWWEDLPGDQQEREVHARWETFLKARDGYAEAQWWEDLPGDQQEQATWSYANHPREAVNWYEAVAFCRWLSAKLGYEVRLPMEVEWEGAARGAGGRVFPWGDAWDVAKVNMTESGIRQTSAVGLYPQGATPEGVHDLVGNIWELSARQYESGNVDIAALGGPVLRGGSWNNLQRNIRAASRHLCPPSTRRNDLGLRVASSAISSCSDH